MQKRTILAILGLLFILSLLVAVGASALMAIGNLLAPQPSNVSINYTARDVDNAQARWKSKNVDTYQIEVQMGGITPPPPIYVVQVWQDKIVYAMLEYRGYDGVHSPAQTPCPFDYAQRLTVPHLFTTARDLAASTDPLSALKSGGATFYYPGGDVKMQIKAEFDPEWGYPRQLSTSANCPDCSWWSNVQKFVAFDSAAPPPTPTLRATPTPHK
jgi:hypothetical protein